MNTFKLSLAPILLSATLVLAACGKKEEMPAPAPAPAPAPIPAPVVTPPPAPAGVTMASLTLGNAVDASGNVTAAMNTFAATDTIYASVATTGSAASAALAAKWTFGEGQIVNESSQAIAPTGPAVTTFHIAKPDGWPVGKYKVEITLDGNAIGSQDFEVK